MGAQLRGLGCAFEVMGSPWRGSPWARGTAGGALQSDAALEEMVLSTARGGEVGWGAAAFIQTRDVRPEPKCECEEAQRGTASQGSGGLWVGRKSIQDPDLARDSVVGPVAPMRGWTRPLGQEVSCGPSWSLSSAHFTRLSRAVRSFCCLEEGAVLLLGVWALSPSGSRAASAPPGPPESESC